MARSLFQKAVAAWRFLWPTRRQRAYARLLRGRPDFDRAYYLRSNPRLHPLFRLFPERHYVCEGEAMGLLPNPGFAPTAYLARNPDLAAAGTPPLRHWIEIGRAEGRRGLETIGPEAVLPMPTISSADQPDPAARTAMVLHLYYPDLWTEFRDRLTAQTIDFDLFVTLTGPAAEDGGATAKRIRSAFPAARTWTVPNRGRDILPFAHLAASGLLAGYDAVCKLHGKVSPHRMDGASWRHALLKDVVGDPTTTAQRLATFHAMPDAGLWVADGHLIEMPARIRGYPDPNRARTEAILARAGVEIDAEAALTFPAGSIYWIKPAVLDRLVALTLMPADFEPERGLVDTTTAHAVERTMGALAGAAGLACLETHVLDRVAARGGLPGGDAR